jgi:hypothetical protein
MDVCRDLNRSANSSVSVPLQLVHDQSNAPLPGFD